MVSYMAGGEIGLEFEESYQQKREKSKFKININNFSNVNMED